MYAVTPHLTRRTCVTKDAGQAKQKLTSVCNCEKLKVKFSDFQNNRTFTTGRQADKEEERKRQKKTKQEGHRQKKLKREIKIETNPLKFLNLFSSHKLQQIAGPYQFYFATIKPNPQ